MGRQLYELIPEEGKHLADSRNTEGAVRGVYLNDETNKACGAGEFMPVDIDSEENRDSVGKYASDENLEKDVFAFAGVLAIGIGIGVVTTKAYPYVKKWVTTTAVPKMKKFWQEVTQKEMDSKQTIKCAKTEATSILVEPEEFSQSIDLVVNKFHADMSNEEVQQHLLNIFCAAMYMANEIQQLSNAVLKDEDRLAWGNVLEKLTTQSVTDEINYILEGKVLILDEKQIKSLTEYLSSDLIVNGVFVPIKNESIKEALLVYPRD